MEEETRKAKDKGREIKEKNLRVFPDDFQRHGDHCICINGSWYVWVGEESGRFEFFNPILSDWFSSEDCNSCTFDWARTKTFQGGREPNTAAEEDSGTALTERIIPLASWNWWN